MARQIASSWEGRTARRQGCLITRSAAKLIEAKTAAQ
jgi:hypothetical protein